jgi:hypothetical protein
LPIATLPKFWLVGVALNWPGVRPVPDKGTLKVGFDALDVIVMLPAIDPDVDGENITPKLAL